MCSICKRDVENKNHILFHCLHTLQVCEKLSSLIGFPYIHHIWILESLKWWSTQKSSRRAIPLFLFWEISNWRNRYIFQNSMEYSHMVVDRIITNISIYSTQSSCTNITLHKQIKCSSYIQWGFSMEQHKGILVHVVFGLLCLLICLARSIGMEVVAPTSW